MVSIPSSEEALADLTLIFPLVYSALEIGTVKAQEFFITEQRDKDDKRNRYLAPSLIRYHAIKELESAHYKIKVVEASSCINLQDVPNNGLMISYGNYDIRILKSNNGELPIPGHSTSRQQYYQQLSFPFHKDIPKHLSKINLIILWNMDRNHSLGDISLACPKAGGHTKDSVEIYWHTQIPSSLLIHEKSIPSTGTYDLDLSPTMSKIEEI